MRLQLPRIATPIGEIADPELEEQRIKQSEKNRKDKEKEEKIKTHLVKAAIKDEWRGGDVMVF